MRRCRTCDYNTITRCYRYQGLGHVARICSAEKVVCSRCAGEGHRMWNVRPVKRRSNARYAKKWGSPSSIERTAIAHCISPEWVTYVGERTMSRISYAGSGTDGPPDFCIGDERASVESCSTTVSSNATRGDSLPYPRVSNGRKQHLR